MQAEVDTKAERLALGAFIKYLYVLGGIYAQFVNVWQHKEESYCAIMIKCVLQWEEWVSNNTQCKTTIRKHDVYEFSL